MSWKSLGVLVAMIAFSGTLMAQDDPFLGIWQLNGDPQGQVIIATPMPGGFMDLRVTIDKDNKVSAESHPVVFDGKPHQTTGGDVRQISYKRIDANTIERTQDRHGEISVDTEEISKDDKTMTIKQTRGTRVYKKLFSLQEIKR